MFLKILHTCTESLLLLENRLQSLCEKRRISKVPDGSSSSYSVLWPSISPLLNLDLAQMRTARVSHLIKEDKAFQSGGTGARWSKSKGDGCRKEAADGWACCPAADATAFQKVRPPGRSPSAASASPATKRLQHFNRVILHHKSLCLI